MDDYVQLPTGEATFLDHLAHWVPDLDAAADALARLGFVLTPTAAHTHSPAPGAPRVPAGSSNRCILLREGYLELLAPTADTPIGREVRAGIDRYVGVHLVAFAVADAARHRERLVAAGFPQRPLVALERETRLASGEAATLRFTVVRPEAGSIPEGRVQFLTHHTPEALWEPRWLAHANGAERLTEVFFCVADPAEAAGRYRRYLDRDAAPIAGGFRWALERGALTILDPAAAEARLGAAPPALPWMAGYAIGCRDPGAVAERAAAAGLPARAGRGGEVRIDLPDAAGGVIVFHRGPTASVD